MAKKAPATRAKASRSKHKRMLQPLPVTRIISGGQTGVDRAALEVAMELDIPHGGWCPRGRLAEDGVIPPSFQLQETESSQYHIRTERNVQESDGTLILCAGPLSGGTRLTRQFAQRHRKTYRVINLREKFPVAFHSLVRCWLRENNIRTLNVAGPRASSARGIEAAAKRFLREVFIRCRTIGDLNDTTERPGNRKRGGD
jgi:hypothetical protein